jgi:heat shock protein HslJ
MKLVIIFAVAIFTQVPGMGCSAATYPVTEAAQSSDSASIKGEWYLLPALASDTATGSLPVLRLQLEERNFTGSTGCNRMSGSFRILGSAIQFEKDITLTKMACEGYNEKEFIMNLLRVDHYKIRDGVLWLMIGQTPVSKWVRKPEPQKTV